MTQTLDYAQAPDRSPHASLVSLVYGLGLLLGLGHGAHFYFLARMLGLDLGRATASLQAFVYVSTLTIGPLLLIAGSIAGLMRRRVAEPLTMIAAIILTVGSLTQLVMHFSFGSSGAERLAYVLSTFIRDNIYTVFAIAIIRMVRRSRR